MLKKVLNILNSLIPKGKYVVFFSFPDLSGNVYSLYEYIMRFQHDFLNSHRLIWMVNGALYEARKRLDNDPNSHSVMVCQKKSLKGLYLYCRASWIISTHNYFSGLYTYGKQKHYNLWHGMPFKTIGRMKSNSKNVFQADYTIATSPLFRDIMEKASGLDKEHVGVTGQPCTDDLFDTRNALQKLDIHKEHYSKILVWMPTYRKSDVGAIRQDGNSDSFGVVNVFSNHLEVLQDVLQRNGILLLIKPHPMDVYRSALQESGSNIRVIREETLCKARVSLYQMLGEADGLLTDYSSVYIDFLNCGKPIAFIYDDMKEYTSSRGFSFEEPESWLPGEKISTFQGLIDYLENMDMVNKRWEKENRRINQLFNQYSDGHSSERVFDFIFGEGK